MQYYIQQELSSQITLESCRKHCAVQARFFLYVDISGMFRIRKIFGRGCRYFFLKLCKYVFVSKYERYVGSFTKFVSFQESHGIIFLYILFNATLLVLHVLEF